MPDDGIQEKRKNKALWCGIAILLLDAYLFKAAGFHFGLYTLLALVAGVLLVLKSLDSGEPKR